MNAGSGNTARALAAAAVLGFVVFLLLVQYAPDTVAFSPNNYGWNGLQGVASTYGVNFTTSFSSLPPRAVLVITQPSIGFTSSDASAVSSFLSGGGTVLVADKSGVANSLLVKLGSVISVQNGYTISDSTYNWKSKSVPTALVLPGARSQFHFLENVSGIALNQPSPLVVSGPQGVDLAITSEFSVASSSTSGVNSTRGPYVVMAAQKFGSGTLIVVGDSQFLLNSEWTIADNRALIGGLFTHSDVYFDASHWGMTSIAQAKIVLGEFYAFVSAPPMRYIATLIMVALAIGFVPGVSQVRITPFNKGEKGYGK